MKDHVIIGRISTHFLLFTLVVGYKISSNVNFENNTSVATSSNQRM